MKLDSFYNRTGFDFQGKKQTDAEFFSKQLKEFTARMKEIADKKAEEEKEAKSKGKNRRDVLVTGKTKKSDILAYIKTLKQKITEVLNSEDESFEVKESRANLLQMKLSELEKILSKVMKAEQEKSEQEKIARKNKIKDSVFLKKDDLTVKDDGSGMPQDSGGVIAPNPVLGGNIDIASGVADAAALSAGEIPNFDVDI